MGRYNYYDSDVRTEGASVWNMDDAQLMRVNNLLNLSNYYFHNWDLENLYWSLRGLRREVNAKLKPEEVEESDKKLKELTSKRNLWISLKITQQEFFQNCEDYYIYLTRLMKKHGLFYREWEDDGGL